MTKGLISFTLFKGECIYKQRRFSLVFPPTASDVARLVNARGLTLFLRLCFILAMAIKVMKSLLTKSRHDSETYTNFSICGTTHDVGVNYGDGGGGGKG